MTFQEDDNFISIPTNHPYRRHHHHHHPFCTEKRRLLQHSRKLSSRVPLQLNGWLAGWLLPTTYTTRLTFATGKSMWIASLQPTPSTSQQPSQLANQPAQPARQSHSSVCQTARVLNHFTNNVQSQHASKKLCAGYCFSPTQTISRIIAFLSAVIRCKHASDRFGPLPSIANRQASRNIIGE